MMRTGFTLIELLVVVAIIGILASVGVVAYSGYTSSTKASVTKDYHFKTIKFLKTEFMKCNAGFDTIMNGQLKCSDLLQNHIGIAHKVYPLLPSTLGFENVWKDKKSRGTICEANDYAVCGGNKWIEGQVSVSAVASKIIIRTCLRPKCAASDRIEEEVEVNLD